MYLFGHKLERFVVGGHCDVNGITINADGALNNSSITTKVWVCWVGKTYVWWCYVRFLSASTLHRKEGEGEPSEKPRAVTGHRTRVPRSRKSFSLGLVSVFETSGAPPLNTIFFPLPLPYLRRTQASFSCWDLATRLVNETVPKLYFRTAPWWHFLFENIQGFFSRVSLNVSFFLQR